MKMKCLVACVFVMSVAAILYAEQSNRPSDKEIRLYMHDKISDEERIRIGRWMMKNGIEVLPLLLEIEEDSDDTFLKSGVMNVIERSVSRESAKSVIDRLLQPDTSDAMKTTALEIAEKHGFKGERYRSVLLEVLSTTEYGGLQKTLLELLRTYGREEDAELALDVFKKTDNRHIKSVASDTLLALGGPEIVGQWEEFWRKWKEKEPERQREKREKEEKMAKEIGVELPTRRPSKFIESIDDDIQSLKEKVKSDKPSSQRGDKPERENIQGEDNAVRDHAERTGENHRQTFDRIGLPLLIALGALIAVTAFFIFARKRNA